jgi:hypothetical protein
MKPVNAAHEINYHTQLHFFAILTLGATAVLTSEKT